MLGLSFLNFEVRAACGLLNQKNQGPGGHMEAPEPVVVDADVLGVFRYGRQFNSARSLFRFEESKT